MSFRLREGGTRSLERCASDEVMSWQRMLNTIGAANPYGLLALVLIPTDTKPETRRKRPRRRPRGGRAGAGTFGAHEDVMKRVIREASRRPSCRSKA